MMPAGGPAAIKSPSRLGREMIETVYAPKEPSQAGVPTSLAVLAFEILSQLFGARALTRSDASQKPDRNRSSGTSRRPPHSPGLRIPVTQSHARADAARCAES